MERGRVREEEKESDRERQTDRQTDGQSVGAVVKEKSNVFNVRIIYLI